jgi:hypothetical protein
MVDAVMGVMIIALSAAVVLTALDVSRRSISAARADKDAVAAFRYLMAVASIAPGSTTGQRDGFTYRTVTTAEKVRDLSVCRVAMTLQRESRVWRLEGLHPCRAS